MKLDIKSTKNLLAYINSSEVVYQTYGGLIEVANDMNIENREELIDFFNQTDRIEIYRKDDIFIQESYADLYNWAMDDDIFFLLQIVEVLLCVPKRIVAENAILED